jgi:Tol biopolymer transport system component
LSKYPELTALDSITINDPITSWSNDSTEIAYIDKEGKINLLPQFPFYCSEPMLSPTESIIAFISYNVYVWNLKTDTNKQLTTFPVLPSLQNATIENIKKAENLHWSPDGEKLAFQSIEDGNYEIYIVNKDGSNLTNLTRNSLADINPVWSPDSSKLAFSRNGNIFITDITNKKCKQITTSQNFEDEPSWSADGSQIAFTVIIDNQKDIFVMNSDGSNQIRLTNNNSDDFQPKWSPY